MVRILNGSKLRDRLAHKLKNSIGKLKDKPGLVIIQIGDQRESNTYIGHKKAFAQRVGVIVKHKRYPSNILEKKVIAEIRRYNSDLRIQGVMIQLPLPPHLNVREILDAIDPRKDVDGLTSSSIKCLFDNNESFLPANSQGLLTLLEHYKVALKGKKVVIVGESTLVGRPTALACLNRGATVSICHINTRNLKQETKQADILIVGAGHPHLITPAHVSKNQVVIDVGFSIHGKKVVGDVDYEKVASRVRAITPVPGGVGPMTVYSLFENLLMAYRNQHSK